jgi:hypothetical protein
MIYGHDKTIHGTEHLDVEVDKHGQVVAVWFRCMALPFEQRAANEDRAVEMGQMYKRVSAFRLRAVDVEIPK